LPILLIRSANNSRLEVDDYSDARLIDHFEASVVPDLCTGLPGLSAVKGCVANPQITRKRASRGHLSRGNSERACRIILASAMMAVENFWDRRNRMPVLMASTSMMAVIALADWWTPPYVSLGFLYLFPIMLAAGFLPRPVLVLVSIICAGLSEAFSSLDPHGMVIRLIFETLALAGCGLFVSELLRSRRLSLETQQRLTALVETSPAAIIIIDEHGTVSRANQAAADLLIAAEGHLIGQPVSCFIPELQNALWLDTGVHFRASMQCVVHRANGERLAADVWFSTYAEKGAPRLAAIIADISEEQPARVISGFRPDRRTPTHLP
jgi:PAS domain S-box-containing protein